jgi:hypothetical protein
MLSDSCHSGTIARVQEYAQYIEIKSPQREPVSAEVKQRFRNVIEGKTATTESASPVRLIPEDVQAKVREHNSAYYTQRGRAARRERDSERAITASVLLLAACQDNQLSLEIGPRGIFTAAVVEVWNGGRFTGGYRAFHQVLQQRMPSYQVPNLFPTGAPDPAFEAEKPFTISR